VPPLKTTGGRPLQGGPLTFGQSPSCGPIGLAQWPRLCVVAVHRAPRHRLGIGAPSRGRIIQRIRRLHTLKMRVSGFIFIQVGGLLQQWVGLGQPIIIRVRASIRVTVRVYHSHSHPPSDSWLVQQCAEPCAPPHTSRVDVLRLRKRWPCTWHASHAGTCGTTASLFGIQHSGGHQPPSSLFFVVAHVFCLTMICSVLMFASSSLFLLYTQ
jgi:hypothetical protein